MNTIFFKAYLIILTLLLSACGGSAVTNPIAIQDAESYTNSGLQAFSVGDSDHAQQLFNKALTLYQGLDNQQGVLSSHINLAQVTLAAGDYPTTQEHLERAADIVKTAEFQSYQPRVTLLLAQSAIGQNEYVQAEKSLQPLLPEFNGLTPVNPPDMIQLTAIASRTSIAFAQQQDESLWTQRYAKALTLSDNNAPVFVSRLLRFQAELLQHQQQYKQAESHLQRALSGYKASYSRPGIATTLAELGRLSMAQGHWADAQSYLTRSNTVFRYIGDLDRVMQNNVYLETVQKELVKHERPKK